MDKEFNASRLSLARRRRGLSRVALAKSVGVSPFTLRAYEVVARRPPEDVVDACSHVLQFPIDFFYGPTLEEPLPSGVSFRALSNLTAAKRDQALTAGALSFAISDWIDERFSIPLPDVPACAELSPEDAALAVRGEWGLGEQPLRNIIHLLERHGVRVFSVTESTYLDAYSTWRPVDGIGNVPYVFLNNAKSPERTRMDAAHELGHLVLHQKGWIRGLDAEKDARIFASALLLPKDKILAAVSRDATLDELIRVKQHWRVSLVALVYRMREIGLLSDWYARQLFMSIGAHGYRANEPNGALPEKSNVLTKVLDSLRRRGITMSQVAKELLITPSELAKQVDGLVPLMPVFSGEEDLGGVAL